MCCLIWAAIYHLVQFLPSVHGRCSETTLELDDLNEYVLNLKSLKVYPGAILPTLSTMGCAAMELTVAVGFLLATRWLAEFK